MAGKLTYTPQQFQEAATQYRQELLMLPIIGCDETLQFMSPRPGVRYKESVGVSGGTAQLAPYKASRSTDIDLDIAWRELETFFGAVVADFEPNSAVSTILGRGATKGDGQMSEPSSIEVLRLIAEGISEHLNDAIWKAVRNPTGDTTLDLFNGFDTITQTEISGGNIADAKGNYLKLQEKFTEQNAVDIAKRILFSLHPKLRAQECYLYCSQDFVDAYNESYLLTHGATPYNMGYEKLTVEGSGGKLILCPLANKADSKFIHVSPKANMLYGFDNMGDIENVMVKEYKPFILTYIATMFFGVQFESIDQRRLKVVELASE